MKENKSMSIVITLLVILFVGYFVLRGSISGQNTVVSQGPFSISVKNADGYYDINSATLIQMFKNKDFALVNVHIPYAGELANTDAFIPYDTIGQNLWKLPSDKNAKIVLYCRSGSMSTKAAQELASRGYTNVYNLTGGMNDWEQEGGMVIKK
ncbi:MAG: rhodanese-like domain-containing protein [Candidatus Yonathbacteria bacterium]|nr:rhodanese-like domain-containing protein [Candidatus Yonathbacteria bacterium]